MDEECEVKNQKNKEIPLLLLKNFLIYKLINDTPAEKLHFNLSHDADADLSTTVCA